MTMFRTLMSTIGGGGVDGEPIIAPTGRTYYRHKSGRGSVMCWNDNGTYRETLILDMKYHNVQKLWGVYGDDVDGITNYTDPLFTGQSINGYILGSSNTTPSAYDGQTDDVLNVKFNWTDEHTSKHNTDALITQYPSGSYAANFCRSILVDGVGCDLPNMQTLVRIFCDRATIHQLDKSDTNNRWSSWFNYYVWTSSELDTKRAWEVNKEGIVGQYYLDGFSAWVVPTLDII